MEYGLEAVGLKTTADQNFQCLCPGGTATIIGVVPFGMKIELHGYDFLRAAEDPGVLDGQQPVPVRYAETVERLEEGKPN